MKKNIRKVLVTIPIGSSENDAKVHIPNGDMVYVGAVVKPSQDQIVDIEILENGSTIQDSIDATWFDGGIGKIEERTILLPYQGGSELEVIASTTNAVAGADVNVELIFLIKGYGTQQSPSSPC